MPETNGKGLHLVESLDEGPQDGSSLRSALGPPPLDPPPAPIAELAASCLDYVQRAVGVRPDYSLETLPLVDHYLRTARDASKGKPEVLQLVARAAGAYFSEVIRKRHTTWWSVDSEEALEWQLQFEHVYLAFSPVAMALAALSHDGSTGAEARPVAHDEGDQLVVEDEDREAIQQRLGELPNVTEDEYYALATRAEVIDIAVEAIRARRATEQLTDGVYRREDYAAG